MCLSTFYALLMGFYIVAVSFAMLVHQTRYKKLVGDLLGNHLVLALTGFLQLIFGLIIVITHNVWVSSWVVVITVLGWIAVLQGICRIYCPEHFAQFAKNMQAKVGFTIISWAWLIVGIYLVWAGYTQ